MSYSKLVRELEKKRYSLLNPSEELANLVECEDVTPPEAPEDYIHALKIEVQENTDAKTLFLTQPELRREPFLFVDAIGHEYLFKNESGRKILGNFLPGLKSEEDKSSRLNSLESLYRQAAFSNGLSLRFCVKIINLYLLEWLCTPIGLRIFQENLVGLNQIVNYNEKRKGFEIEQYGLLNRLFTAKGFLALKLKLITVEMVLECRYNEECQALIDGIYNFIKKKAEAKPSYQAALEELKYELEQQEAKAKPVRNPGTKDEHVSPPKTIPLYSLGLFGTTLSCDERYIGYYPNESKLSL